MDKKGFTVVELLATLVILSIVVGLTLSVFSFDFGNAKKKTEEVFVDTIRDSLDMYLSSSSVKRLNFVEDRDASLNDCFVDKTHGDVKMYKAMTTFKAVIDSEFHPITQKDLVNPADEELICRDASSISVDIYRDADYVYYYSVDKNNFDCLKNIGGEYDTVITNLPEGYDCR